MSTHCLGNHFDIHGGGLDLQFPHHENEIAQSCAATGEEFVNVWMHNGFVRVDNEKMSKSLGNFFTIREVLKKYAPEVIRYFILSSHYRSPLNYSDQHLDNAKAALTTLYTALRDIKPSPPLSASAPRAAFLAAMDDDFNTPLAMAQLFELAREINRCRVTDAGLAARLAGELLDLAGMLGLLQQPPEAFLQGSAGEDGDTTLSTEAVNALLEQRLQARASKNWAESDRIRDQLKAAGIVIEDGAQGTTWRRD